MDPIGVFIATLHNMVGHDVAAALIGFTPGDKAACLLCQYERQPDDLRRQAVVRALAPKSSTEEE